MFAAYLDEQEREILMRLSPKTCEILSEILMLPEDDKNRLYLQEKARQEQEKAAEERARRVAEEGYGPGQQKKKEGP